MFFATVKRINFNLQVKSISEVASQRGRDERLKRGGFIANCQIHQRSSKCCGELSRTIRPKHDVSYQTESRCRQYHDLQSEIAALPVSWLREDLQRNARGGVVWAEERSQSGGDSPDAADALLSGAGDCGALCVG